MQTNALHRFLFEDSTIRGEIVQLESSWQKLYARQDYPAVIRQMLGEATVAGVLLAATIKFSGSLTLQLNTDGPLSFLVVECTGEHHLRGLARWQGNPLSSQTATVLGDGQLMLTIDQGADSERYRSVIELDGGNFTGCLEHYFNRSEQLPTRLWLAADDQRASGILLQKMPETQSATDADLWDRATALATTVSQEELLRLEPKALLSRLFHEETVRVFEPQSWVFNCPCSQARVDSMLRSLGREGLQSILDEQGKVGVDCEFCGHTYRYDAVDVEQLLSSHPGAENYSNIRH